MPISKSEFSYTMEIDTEGVPQADKKEALEVAGQVILSNIVEYLDNQSSPVSSGSYKKGLSKEYKKQKKARGLPGIADLQLTDAMLSNLDIDTTNSTIKFQLDESTQILKGYNHNVGDTLPKRQWMPDDSKNQKFKPNVLKEAKNVIESFKKDSKGEEFTEAERDALREFIEGLS